MRFLRVSAGEVDRPGLQAGNSHVIAKVKNNGELPSCCIYILAQK